MAEDKLERIYTVPLGKAYDYARLDRTPRAVKMLREFLIKHMKGESVVLSNALNAHLWEGSIQRPPRHVKVRAVREGKTVKAFLTTEKEEKKVEKKEAKKEEAPAKKEEKPAEKKEGKAPEKKEERPPEKKAAPEKKPEVKKEEPKEAVKKEAKPPPKEEPKKKDEKK